MRSYKEQFKASKYKPGNYYSGTFFETEESRRDLESKYEILEMDNDRLQKENDKLNLEVQELKEVISQLSIKPLISRI